MSPKPKIGTRGTRPSEVLRNFLPDFDFRHPGAQFIHLWQQNLDVRVFQVRVEVRLARPVFME